jgi:ABC-type multidrug transport system ATPase subunit
LELDGIGKSYADPFGRRRILRDVSFAIGPGVTVLVGPNGAGKTTLLRILAAVVRPTAGRVSWCGRAVAADSVAYRDLIGYLPQDFRPYPELTPAAFLAYVSALKGIPEEMACERADEVLRLCGLSGLSPGGRCAALSRGRLRLLGLAQALLNDPPLLLLDEPTSGLDPEARVRIMELVRRLSAGKVVLFSTHLLADAAQVADWVLALDEGRLAASSDPAGFLAPAQGRVFEGVVETVRAAALRAVKGLAVVAQVPSGPGRSRVRVVTPGATPPLPGLRPIPPDFEDAYVCRRLLARPS